MTTIQRSFLTDDVVVLRLEKPPANAIDEHLLSDLDQALREVRDDDRVRALVLTGTGAFFSAGFDFAAPRRDDEVALDLYGLYRDCHRSLLTMPKPTIARINGHAIAGGFVLALACDHRIAVHGDYRIGMNEIAVGASFPRAAMEIVRLRLSHVQATSLVLGAQLYPSAAAISCGLAQETASQTDLDEHVRATAVRLAGLGRDGYAHSKNAFVADAAARIDAETDGEALAAMAVWISEESRAARRRQRERLRVRGASGSD